MLNSTVVFTSGRGQYYCIEAVAQILESFTEQDYEYFRAYIWNKNLEPHEIRAYIDTLLREGKIKNLSASEINCDTTRRCKVTNSDTQNLSDAFLKGF